jgi:hypothetical protein
MMRLGFIRQKPITNSRILDAVGGDGGAERLLATQKREHIQHKVNILSKTTQLQLAHRSWHGPKIHRSS